MVTSLTHSRNASDEPILHSLDQQLQRLTSDQKAGLAIVSLYTATESKNAKVYINCDCGKFISAVELLLQLSISGKLALVRAIAEELAVLEHLLEVKK